MRFFVSGVRPQAVAIVSPLKLLELCRRGCKRLATGGNKAARGSGRAAAAAAAAGRHHARILRLAIVFAFVFL
jgi:hypothetical protein